MARNTPATITDVATRVAKAKGIEPAQAAKLVRGRIRANYDLVSSNWPELRKQGKVNKDGNRYPAMPPALADALVTSMTKGTALKDALAKPRKAKAHPQEGMPGIKVEGNEVTAV